MRFLTSVLVLTSSLVFSLSIFGSEAYTIKPVSENIEFDGYPYEEAWQGLDFFPMVMNRPNFGNEPAEKSEVMITYDDQYLWIGARLFSKDPKNIKATSKKRDELSRNSDSFGIILDTYNDNENAMAFFTMPTGARIDYTISNDGQGSGGGQGFGGGGGGGFGGSMNMSWNTFWDVKTSRDDKGWYVEIRIPFSSLRFQNIDNLASMGLIINRSISYNNELDTYPALNPKYGFNAATKPSLATDIHFENVKPSRPIYISPYVISGYSKSYQVNDDYSAYEPEENPELNAGLDVKYNVNSNLTLDLTVNTDFAQVEADNQQVNLTRYSLFFPEKRMFFQERSSLFSFNLGGSSDLFYSRNIGMSSDGTPLTIYGGARLIGKMGKWEMGVLDMQTEEYDTILPGENFGLFRLRKQVINPNSYIGGIFTSRLGMNGDQNFAYGIDGIFRVFGEDYLEIRAASAYDNILADTTDFSYGEQSFLLLNWERRSQKGIGYELGYTYSGRAFEPDMGFVQRPSLQGLSGRLQYGWLPGSESKLYSYSASVRFSGYQRLDDRGLESVSVEPGVNFNTKKGYIYRLGMEWQREGVVDYFPVSFLDNIWIIPGYYNFVNLQASFSTPMTKPFSVTTMFNPGQYYDGWRLGGSVMPMYNISSSLQLSGSYSLNYITFPDRSPVQSIYIHSGYLRAMYMLNTKLSASALVQYTSTRGDFVFNFRLRYNPKEGNDLYIVVNDYQGFLNKEVYPPLPDYYDRTIMIKYTHTFKL